jgi:hypothetical protein
MKALLPIVVTIVTGVYFRYFPPEDTPKPHERAQPYTLPLKKGDVSTQLNHVWNFGAPLAADVSERISKRDYKITRGLAYGLEEVPRSIHLHEGDLTPANVTFSKVLYLIFLCLSGAAALLTYVLPML